MARVVDVGDAEVGHDAGYVGVVAADGVGYEVVHQQHVAGAAEQGCAGLRVDVGWYLVGDAERPFGTEPFRHVVVPARHVAQRAASGVGDVGERHADEQREGAQVGRVEVWAGDAVHMHGLDRLRPVEVAVRHPDLDLGGGDRGELADEFACELGYAGVGEQGQHVRMVAQVRREGPLGVVDQAGGVQIGPVPVVDQVRGAGDKVLRDESALDDEAVVGKAVTFVEVERHG